DLLPVLIPHCFPKGFIDENHAWLSQITELSNGLICISNAVADEMKDWVREHAPGRCGTLGIDSFPLGADLEKSAPSQGLPPDHQQTERFLLAHKTFLMVGTLEPRKGHAQVLSAF